MRNRNPRKLTIKKVIKTLHGGVLFRGGIEITNHKRAVIKTVQWPVPKTNKRAAEMDATNLKIEYANDVLLSAGVC